VSDHTRGYNILDIVLSNYALCSNDVTADSPIGTSDHCSVQFELLT